MAEENKKLEYNGLSVEEQKEKIRQFANGLYGVFSGIPYATNPYIQNRNLIELNNDPQVPTYEKILKALENAPINYESLVGYSEFMETFDNLYRKVIDHYVGLLSFDIHYYPDRDLPQSDYNSKEYKDDLRRVEKFLMNFDYKQNGINIIKEVLRRETSYVWFRDSHSVIDSPIDVDDDKVKKNEKFALQIMPQRYCKTTGYYDNGRPLYEFDMNYFLKGTVDINLFDPSFKKKYREVFGDNRQGYNPSSPIGNRNGEFATWVQTDPKDGAYIFKLDLSNFRQVPKFSALLKSAIDDTVIEKLQKDKNIASAYALLMGTMPLMDNLKSGDKPNQFAIQPEFIGNLVGMIAQSLVSNIKSAPLPTKDNKLVQFQDYNASMLKNQLKTTAGQGASASDMIYSDEKLGQFAEQQALEEDFAIVKPIYLQFAEFMNYFVNRKLKKYRFTFSFDGIDRSFYRDAKFKNMSQMATTMGIVLDESHWASCYEMKPYEFRRSMQMAHYGGITDWLTPLLNSNTSSNKSGSSKKVGNTELDSNNKNDGGDTADEYK